MVPRPGGSGLLISILVSATVGRAQDLCIGGDPEPQGSLVCRRATMPPTMQIDSPRIPTPQTTVEAELSIVVFVSADSDPFTHWSPGSEMLAERVFPIGLERRNVPSARRHTAHYGKDTHARRGNTHRWECHETPTRLRGARRRRGGIVRP